MLNKQDFMNAINRDIEMVRGDTLTFNFTLKGLESSSAYEALTVTFSVADHYDATPLIEVTNGDGIELESYDASNDVAMFNVYVAPNNTKNLDLARYYYDLQIKTDNDVITLMRGRFTIVYDVAD